MECPNNTPTCLLVSGTSGSPSYIPGGWKSTGPYPSWVGLGTRIVTQTFTSKSITPTSNTPRPDRLIPINRTGRETTRVGVGKRNDRVADRTPRPSPSSSPTRPRHLLSP